MAIETGEFRWVRPPIQARSQASLSRILDAAQEVISERGFAGATVADIVKHAKSSIGVFYDRFRDKEALLDCLHERFCDESCATADEALSPERWRGATLEEILTKLVAFLVQIYRANRGILRAFLVRCGADSAFAERGNRVHVHIVGKLQGLIADHAREIGHPQPTLAVEFGLKLVGGTLDSLVLFDDVERTGTSLDDAACARELTRAFVAYLGVEAKPRAGKRKRPAREPVA